MDIFRCLFVLFFLAEVCTCREKQVFEERFCKNTVYRFLNSMKTNWQRFMLLFSARIINGCIKPLISLESKGDCWA